MLYEVITAALAGVLDLGARPRPANDPLVDQRVIDDHIGLVERVQRMQRP